MNTPAEQFPHLGFGLGLRIPHYAHIFEHWPSVDWFEIISENFMDTDGRARRNLERVRARYPIVMHGVSLSIGSVDVLDSDYLRQLRQLADAIQPAWISDHLCWTGVAHKNLHDLLPVPYTEEALRHIVARVQQVQDYLGRPIALENPSTYLEFASSQIPEAEFLAELSRRSGCRLLLDVNNVYVSCFNHRQDPGRYLDALPMDRVVQIHLSGHSHCGTHIIDTHDDHVVDAVWALYADVLGRAGRPLNTMIEWDANIPPWDVLAAELAKARQVASGVHAGQAAAPGSWAGTTSSSSIRVDTRPRTTLADEQQRLQDTVLRGPTPATPQGLDWIRPKPGFDATAQMAVYVNAYRSRLFEVTAEDFPVLRQALGDARFNALLTAFVSQTRSVHYNIARYASGVPGFVAKALPHDVLAQEIAVLEDAISQVQDMAETEPLTQAHLAGLTADTLDRAVLQPRRAARLFEFQHPVDAYYTAVQEGGQPPLPTPQASHLLVYRNEDVVWRMRLDEGEFRLLQALAAGRPVGEAVAALPNQVPATDDSLENALARWFSRWLRNGVLRHPVGHTGVASLEPSPDQALAPPDGPAIHRPVESAPA